MKKIFTLMLSATLFSSAFAQYDSRDQNDHKYDKGRDVGINDNRHKNEDERSYDKYSSNNREKDMQIMQINREYDYRIQAVKNKPFMNWYKKARMISMLEDQRNDEIRMVYAQFNNKHDHYYDKRSRGRW
jgi:hypothetical protein